MMRPKQKFDWLPGSVAVAHPENPKRGGDAISVISPNHGWVVSRVSPRNRFDYYDIFHLLYKGGHAPWAPPPMYEPLQS